MCDIIHAVLFGDVDAAALEQVNARHKYKLRTGTKHQLKVSLKTHSEDFRVSDGMCDCDSTLGRGDPDTEEVGDFADLIREASRLPGAKTLSFCYTADHRTENKREIVLNRDERDLRELLSRMLTNTLYTIRCPRGKDRKRRHIASKNRTGHHRSVLFFDARPFTARRWRRAPGWFPPGSGRWRNRS